MIKLQTPFKLKDINNLKIGDRVLLSGVIYTARDKAHQFLIKNTFPFIEGSVIYHCGPLVKNNEVIAAGPTTSSRMNKYTPKLIKKYKIRAIIGKGGMDKNVSEALRDKAVYFSAIGGAAVIYAKMMKIIECFQEEFGMTEAIWKIEVINFPLIVTMDCKGNNLYEEICHSSKGKLQKFLNR